MSIHRTSRSVLISIVVLCGLLFAMTAGQARAAEQPFTLQFDQSAIGAGFLGDVPLDSLSGPSSIEGTIDGQGNVKIPKGKFLMPVLDLSTIAQSLAGIDLPVKIQGFMGIEQPATGTFDRATGKLEIQTKAGIWVSIDVQQLLGSLGGLGVSLPPELSAITGLLGNDLTCGFSPMDVTFTTESTSLGTGQRFTKGLEGPGALTGEWSQLGPFAGKTKFLGFLDVCKLIRDQLPSLLSGLGGQAAGGIDLSGLDLGSLLAQLDTLDLGPTALTITRTVDQSPTPAKLKLKVSPKQRKVLAGRTTSYRAVVVNKGGTAAEKVRVCAVVPKRKVNGTGCRSLGRVGPGKAGSRHFRLKLARGKDKSPAKVNFVLRSNSVAAA